MQATGPFQIQMKPEPGGVGNRMSFTKQYTGALEANADGEMISGGDPRAGVAGYVAFETVTGTLDGREGSFQIMQWGTMNAGSFELRAGVVPGSGTGALAGISGTVKLENNAGQHTYALEYTLATAEPSPTS